MYNLDLGTFSYSYYCIFLFNFFELFKKKNFISTCSCSNIFYENF